MPLTSVFVVPLFEFWRMKESYLSSLSCLFHKNHDPCAWGSDPEFDSVVSRGEHLSYDPGDSKMSSLTETSFATGCCFLICEIKKVSKMQRFPN